MNLSDKDKIKLHKIQRLHHPFKAGDKVIHTHINRTGTLVRKIAVFKTIQTYDVWLVQTSNSMVQRRSFSHWHSDSFDRVKNAPIIEGTKCE